MIYVLIKYNTSHMQTCTISHANYVTLASKICLISIIFNVLIAQVIMSYSFLL